MINHPATQPPSHQPAARVSHLPALANAAFSAARSAAYMPAFVSVASTANITVNLATGSGALLANPDLKQLLLDVFNDPSNPTFYSQAMNDYRALWVSTLPRLLR
jgi:hypothetical protein